MAVPAMTMEAVMAMPSAMASPTLPDVMDVALHTGSCRLGNTGASGGHGLRGSVGGKQDRTDP